MEQKKVHSIAIDLLKVLAALMITNSHLKSFYVEPFTPLGTFGAPGNALFFFISGFTLSLGRFDSFTTWYKRRIQRIFPTLLIWTILLSPLLSGTQITLQSIWFAKSYWFIQCIMVYYILWWLIFKFLRKYLVHIIYVSIAISVISFLFIIPITPYSIYIHEFHYICFFSIFILGSYIALNRRENKGKIINNILLSFLYLVLFYFFQFIGKGKDGIMYYLQIISIIPLHLFIIHIYKMFSFDKITSYIVRSKIFPLLKVIGNLTLEVYIVGFTLHFIPIEINNIFPLNIPIVILFVIVLALILKICTKVFLNIFFNKPLDIKKIFY